jgi:hypothetical protein
LWRSKDCTTIFSSERKANKSKQNIEMVSIEVRQKNLSLITASSLVTISEGFRNSKHKQFPYQLLLKDVLIKEERILKAISK